MCVVVFILAPWLVFLGRAYFLKKQNYKQALSQCQRSLQTKTKSEQSTTLE